MFSSKMFILLFTICLYTHLQCGNSVVQKSRDSRRIQKGFLFINKNSFDEGNLIYAVCENNSSRIKTCNVVQKVYPAKESIRSCTIILKGDQEESRLNTRIGVSTLGKNKAILFWGDNYNNSSITKIGTIDLESCKMNEVTIPDPKQEVLMEMFYTEKMVTYEDDTFDVFFNDSNLCGEKLCGVPINNDGIFKSQPMASNFLAKGFVHYISPIASRSPSKGYAYLTRIDSNYILFLVKSDGTEKQLEIYDRTARPVVVASNNVVSACTKANVDTNAICTQYDENGNVKFATIIPEEYQNTQPRAVNNLPDGGILVMLAEITQCDHLLNCYDTHYHMVRLAPDGKLMGTARTEEFDSVTSEWKQTYVYKYGDFEYCAVLVGQIPILDKQLLSYYEILYHCVTENEFLG